MHTVIIGAGAAGCFAAIELKRECPEMDITLLERATHPLAKVAITGGGRCNLTNSFAQVKSLEQVYPRGFRLMKRLFHQFSPQDTCKWFENEGVHLVTQEDECIFPCSQNAMQIVHTLQYAMQQAGVRLITRTCVERILHHENKYQILANGETYRAEQVLVTTGGQPKPSGMDFLSDLSLNTVPPVPSLFSLCLADEGIRTLMGTVVTETTVSLPGTKKQANGPLLITHWGVSGPAVLKLSSYAARELAKQNYTAQLCIRWTGNRKQDDILEEMNKLAVCNRQKKITSVHPEGFQSRLWDFLVNRAGLAHDTRYADLKGKALNRLVQVLTADTYDIIGKNRFKEEFVTCGGVNLTELNTSTLEVKKHPGLFMAGEVTDVDAITGGFNLQAAWTMGYVAARAMAKRAQRNPINSENT